MKLDGEGLTKMIFFSIVIDSSRRGQRKHLMFVFGLVCVFFFMIVGVFYVSGS